MASKRVFKYRGFTIEELQEMSMDELLQLLPARARRSLLRERPYSHQKLHEKILKAKEGKIKKPIKTHCRDFIILPDMVGVTLLVYNGKDWNPVEITPEKIGHYLGEYSMTCKIVKHSGPGVGATRGSKFVPLK